MEAPETLEPVSLVGIDRKALLRHWGWLVPLDFEPICVTRLGDMILEDPHGSVWFLDAGGGSLTLVAGNEVEWRGLLRDPERANQWSGRALVARLESQGLQLNAGQCYTYWQSPMMGGSYEPANFKIVGIQQHFDIWGPILGLAKDIPDGTEIRLVVKP